MGTSNEVDLAYMGQNEWFGLPGRWYFSSGNGELLLTGIEPTDLNERGVD